MLIKTEIKKNELDCKVKTHVIKVYDTENVIKCNVKRKTFDCGVGRNVIGVNYGRQVFIAGVSVNTVRGRLEKSFTFEDFEDLSLEIGNIPAGKRVMKAVLVIQTAFNEGAKITIGDDDAEGRLMSYNQNNPLVSNYYVTEQEVKYLVTTPIKIYFPYGNPTSGEGVAIIYYL